MKTASGKVKTVGILGAGQLARMLAQAGQAMGLEFIFLDPAGDVCAASLGEHICADWHDQVALRKLAQLADVVTFEFENIPEQSVRLIESICPVYPPSKALYISQDRLREKTCLQALHIPVALFYPVTSRPELLNAMEQIGLPCVLKTRRLGYDGKGQTVLRFKEDLERAWQILGDHDLLCEGFVPFDVECSIIAVRGQDGRTAYWPLTRNLHRDGVLAISQAPAFDRQTQTRAEALVKRLLDHLDYIGVLALELFLQDGELLANEFAPRVHNSGHWTIDGADTSQFENHLRAICDLPMGETRNNSQALMFNLLGEMPNDVNMASMAGVHWHDYHKVVRAGRKLGHVTVTAQTEPGLKAMAVQLATKLGVAAELNLEAIFQHGG